MSRIEVKEEKQKSITDKVDNPQNTGCEPEESYDWVLFTVFIFGLIIGLIVGMVLWAN